MARARAREFVKDQGAGVALEFVTLMPAFLLVTFFALEVAIALFWVGTAEKAVQLGARLAVVSHYAATKSYAGGNIDESTRYALTSGGTYVYGQNCQPPGTAGPCVAFPTMTCNGSGGLDCRSGACFGEASRTCFQVIADRIRNTTAPPAYRGIMSSISNQNISITYEYVGLGYAGGPLVPRVTVTVTGVPYPSLVTSIVSRLFTLILGGLGGAAPPAFTTLPPITVTLTGEDQSTAGVVGT